MLQLPEVYYSHLFTQFTIDAVNTVTIKNGKTKGHNTDKEGFVRSLEEEGQISVTGKQIYIIGCGGASGAIAMTLAFNGADKIFQKGDSDFN